jgi:phage terminase large subunit
MTNAWIPHPGPQTEVLKRTEFEVLFGGSRGGGKTQAGIAWLSRWVNNPQFRALIIRRNADDLSDWVGRAREMYSGLGADFAYRPTEIKFPSGALFKTGHLKDENAYGKYLGHEYQKMVIEELTQIPTEESYLKLISSCRSTVKGLEPQVFMTTNPGGPGHSWVRQRFIDIGEWGVTHIDPVTKRGRIFIRSKLEDNPTLMKSDPTYIQFLESLPENLRKAWKDGSWEIVAGQVFTDWRRETHVINEFAIPPEWNRWISLDWGVNAPFCVLWFTEGYDKRIYCVRELYMNGVEYEKTMGVALTPKKLAKTINLINSKMGWSDYQYLVADPACWNHPEGGESIAETMMGEGLKMVQADNDRVHGLARMREYLSLAPDGRPYLQFFRNCINTVQTIPALSYDERKLEDVDTSLADHAYDSARYFLMSRPAVTSQLPDPITNLLSYDYKKKTQGDPDDGETILEM